MQGRVCGLRVGGVVWPRAPAYRGQVPVEAACAEVGHGGLVALVGPELGSPRQQPLGLSL